MNYLFFIFIVYAVKCQDVGNNYFVVEMPEDDPPQEVKDCKKPFQVYWNVPTMQCVSKKVVFEDLYEKFGIIQNNNDRFIGEKITIMYEPGDFPAIFKNETSGKYRLRNGGVPQEGDLNIHITAFKSDLNVSIPDPDFDGVGIIDFESWRPVFRQNFGNLVPYKDVSIEIEKQLHWWWTKSMIQAEATRRFEAAARQFMQTTLSIAKQMRPNAVWGFYGFPYCFNMASNNLNEACANNVPEENDGIYWLWSESTALFPSIYSSVSLSSSQLSSLINGRVQESARVRVNNTPILPYFWFKYRDDGFMSKEDLSVALSTLYKSKASGLIIWGSSNDVNTSDKCNDLYNYIETVLGPNVAKYTKNNNKMNDDNDNKNDNDNNNDSDNDNNNDSTTIEPSQDIENTTASTRMGQLDPEYYWVPPKNYSEDISQQVDEELTKKGLNKTSDDYKMLNQGAVFDLLFDALLNAKSNLGNQNIRDTDADLESNDSSDKSDLKSTDDETYEISNETTTNEITETNETTENNENMKTDVKNENEMTDEISDYLIPNEIENSSVIINEETTEENLENDGFRETTEENLENDGFRETTEEILENDGFRETTEENLENDGFRETTEENLENDAFRDTTEDVDKVVGYLYSK